MLDKEAMRFQARVMKLAQEIGASCEGQAAEPWLDGIYARFKTDAPSDRDAWIREELKAAFLSVADPPNWVESEPSWPFWEGRPMVFVTQYALPDSAVARDSVTTHEVIYIFGVRLPAERGYRVEYRIVTQHPGIDGVGYR